ncbi:MAG: hypothetical protein ACREXT_10955 [Gammaproteobacteria bacterium]
MTRRESIIQAAVAAVMAALPGISVYREAVGAMPRDAGVFIVVRPLSDSANARVNEQQDHKLIIAISIVTRGVAAEMEADSYCSAAHVALTSNQNIGGALSVMFERTVFSSEEADSGAVSVVETTYVVDYRSLFTSL